MKVVSISQFESWEESKWVLCFFWKKCQTTPLNSHENWSTLLMFRGPDKRRWKHLPGTPRADVECNFGLWFRLIGAASLAELTAGWSQPRHTLHPQVIQVLWGQREWNSRGGKGKTRKMERKQETERTAINHPLSLPCKYDAPWWQSAESQRSKCDHHSK